VNQGVVLFAVGFKFKLCRRLQIQANPHPHYRSDIYCLELADSGSVLLGHANPELACQYS